MNGNRHEEIENLFTGALAVSETERRKWLETACGSDRELLAEVESLLRAYALAPQFLTRSIFEDVPESGQAGGDDPLAGRTLGPWRIVRLIATGGMGVVYLGERIDDSFRKEVAIKLMAAGTFHEGLLSRFRTERQVLADLDHPGIARLIDGGTTVEGIPYLVMEYVEGVELREAARQLNLSVQERLELFLGICDAVQYAHANLVIHRDLKPGNILVREDGHPKLLDFGIAKVFQTAPEPEADAATTWALTPKYASPEQLLGERITTATDIYSLGVVLYELLTDRLPYDFSGGPIVEMARVISTSSPLPPSRVPEVPGARRLTGDIDTIVLKALAREPARRFATVSDFADDIRRHLNGEPVLARGDSAVYRLGRFAARHRGIVGGVAAFFLLLLSALMVTISLYRDARNSAARERWHAYTSTLAAVESAIMNHHVHEARKLMATMPPDLRGWERRHLEARLDRSIVRWRAHQDGITRVRFSPDASRILTTGIDRAARVWDTATRDTLAAWTFDSEVESGCFFPDGQQVALGLTDGRVMIASPGFASPESIGAGTPSAIVEVHPDGDVVAAGFDNGDIALLDVAAGREVRRWKAHSRFTVPRFSPDGSILATAGSDSVIRLWNAGTGELRSVLRGHRHRVYTIAFSQDGRILVSGSMDHTATVWSLETGSALRSFSEHRGTVAALAIHPSSREVLSAGTEGRMMVWDATTGSRTAEYHGHDEGDVTSIDITTSGDWSISADWDGQVRIWNWGTEDVSTRQLPRSADVVQISDFDLDPTGTRLVGATSSRQPFLGGHSERFLVTLDAPGTVCTASMDSAGGFLAGLQDGRILRFATPDGKPDTISAHEGPVLALRVCRTRPLAASAGNDGIVRLWSLPELRLLQEMKGHTARVNVLGFSPTDETLASGSHDGTIRIWNTATGDSVSLLRAENTRISDLAFHPDGRLLASVASSIVHLWNLEADALADTIVPRGTGAWAVAFSPDGERIATGGADQLIRLFDTARRSEILRLHGHIGAITRLRFTPDGEILVSSGRDGAIRFWEAPATGSETP